MEKITNLYDKYHCNTSARKKFPTENNFTHFYSFKAIKKYLCRVKNALELGCGAGTNLFYLAKKGIKITGVDISEKAILSCLEGAKYLGITKMKFINNDILKFRSKRKYDLIICFEVLEHLVKDIDCLKNIYEMLSDNGKVLISVPSENSVFYRSGLITKNEKVIGHLRRYNKEKIILVVKKTKFKIIEIQRVEGPLRDILFHIKPFGFIIRFLKGPLSIIVNYFDLFLSKLFGESRIILVLSK